MFVSCQDTPSSLHRSALFRSAEKELPLPEEETVQFNPEDVLLDFCTWKTDSRRRETLSLPLDTSDLNLTFNPDCLSAGNKSNDALCFLWAGTRATYGFQRGKICYEIRVGVSIHFER